MKLDNDLEFIAKTKETREIDDGQRDSRGDPGTQEDDRGYYDDDDGDWYMGKAKEEFHRRKQGAPDGGHEDEDPVQVNVFRSV